jgi:hypothetical protein
MALRSEVDASRYQDSSASSKEATESERALLREELKPSSDEADSRLESSSGRVEKDEVDIWSWV